MGNKVSDSEIRIKLEVRQGSKVKKQIWRDYTHSFFVDYEEIFEVLKEEVESSLKLCRRW